MNDGIHNIHNVYSRPPVRSEIWDISHCQRCEISPICTATNVSLSSFLCLPSSHPPSLALLSFSLSLFSSFPFFSAPTLKPGGWRGSGCTCRVAEALLKESIRFWKSLRRFRPLHVPVLSLSAQTLHIRQLLSSCALLILSLPLSFSFLSFSLSLSTFLWFRQIYSYASSPLALMSCKTHPSQHNDR